jgi:hypothetical protein
MSAGQLSILGELAIRLISAVCARRHSLARALAGLVLGGARRPSGPLSSWAEPRLWSWGGARLLTPAESSTSSARPFERSRTSHLLGMIAASAIVSRSACSNARQALASGARSAIVSGSAGSSSATDGVTIRV